MSFRKSQIYPLLSPYQNNFINHFKGKAFKNLFTIRSFFKTICVAKTLCNLCD